MTSQTPLEVEVKFYVPDLAQLRQRLEAAGAERVKPRLFERNVRFDDASETLRQKGQLLRLRQDDGARLTFKGMAAEDQHSQAKVREELEIEISNFEMAATILQRLGFAPQQVYEKYRETFRLGTVEVVLDEMPFGNFVELEGDEAKLKQVAQQLQLDWEQRILDNYLLLMARLKRHHHLPFDDLTFENFAGSGLDVNIDSILGPESPSTG
jgi:adenylate cyclase class 2